MDLSAGISFFVGPLGRLLLLAYELGYRVPLWAFHKVHHTAEVLTPHTVKGELIDPLINAANHIKPLLTRHRGEPAPIPAAERKPA